jgi:hypothetical protein
MITISGHEIATLECANVIIAPKAALHQAGYIRTLTAEKEANAKHTFFALAQMAFFQYEDGEIKAEIFGGRLAIRHGQNEEWLEDGLIICQDIEGLLRLLAHKETNVAKLLEATNRFCTRWVRLDISCPTANPPHHTIT